MHRIQHTPEGTQRARAQHADRNQRARLRIHLRNQPASFQRPTAAAEADRDADRATEHGVSHEFATWLLHKSTPAQREELIESAQTHVDPRALEWLETAMKIVEPYRDREPREIALREPTPRVVSVTRIVRRSARTPRRARAARVVAAVAGDAPPEPDPSPSPSRLLRLLPGGAS